MQVHFLRYGRVLAKPQIFKEIIPQIIKAQSALIFLVELEG